MEGSRAARSSRDIGEQAWHMIQSPSSLWCKILKGLYFPHFDFESTGRVFDLRGVGRVSSWAEIPFYYR